MTTTTFDAREYRDLLLDKQKIEASGVALVEDYFIQLRSYDGKACTKCGLVQAESYRGHRKYYCVHTTNIIDREQRKNEQKVCEEIMLWTRRAVEVMPASARSASK